jgi:hypothetical protein
MIRAIVAAERARIAARNFQREFSTRPARRG